LIFIAGNLLLFLQRSGTRRVAEKNINERLASDPSFYPLPGFQLMLLMVVLLFITVVICASGSARPRLKCLFCLFNADRHASLSSTLAVEDEEGLKGLQSGFFLCPTGAYVRRP